MDYGHILWCYPTVSYHHLSPSVVEDLWNFEQDRFSKHWDHASLILRHWDIYAEFVLLRTLGQRRDWNNYADHDRGPMSSFDDCRDICKDDISCLQYSLSGNSRCLTASTPRLGEASLGGRSGWLSERMQEFYDKAQLCDYEEWIM